MFWRRMNSFATSSELKACTVPFFWSSGVITKVRPDLDSGRVPGANRTPSRMTGMVGMVPLRLATRRSPSALP
jgi:hypothetical protein